LNKVTCPSRSSH